MIRFAALFLVIALIAGVLGIYPVEAIGSQIAWAFFVLFIVLFIISLVVGGTRTGPPL